MAKTVKKVQEQVQVKEVKPKEVQAPEKTIAELQAEAISNKVIMDMNNSDKAHKDVLLMNTRDLEAHIKFLNDRITELDREFVTRRRLVDGINGSIAGAQSQLSNLKAEFDKQNGSALALLNKQLAEVEKADTTLRQLMKENQEINASNKHKESQLEEQKQICSAQVYEMKKALDQNNSEWNKREKDILDREEILKEEKKALELEKDSLKPEFDRISSVKNENILLLQEVELERNTNRNMLAAIESERQFFNEQKLVDEAKNQDLQLALSNQEKKLREWEQQLKDFDLEVRARSAKADKLLRTMQLEKEANAK